MADMCAMVNGRLGMNASGEFGVIRFDSTAAAVDSWTVDDIIPGSIQQEPLEQNVVNTFISRFYAEEPDADTLLAACHITDTPSLSARPASSENDIPAS